MRPHNYSDEGFVLSRRNFGEADRLLSLYTKNNGRISLIAKGVRRPKSKKRGHIEVFTLVKFQANQGRGIDIMTEAEVVEDFAQIRMSLKKVSLAYYISEVVGKITHESEPNTQLFNLIHTIFTKLKTTKLLRALRQDFILKLLTLTGFWPEGKVMTNHDTELAEVVERQIHSERVGKIMLK